MSPQPPETQPNPPPILGQPAPIEPLTYARPGSDNPARLGILTSVGIVSVILGLLGAVVNVAQALYFIELFQFAGPPTSLIKVPVIADPQVVPYDGDLIGSRGWKRPARQAAIAALEQRGVSADRLEMFDRLLSEAGRDVFPGVCDEPTTPAPSAEQIDRLIARHDPNEPLREGDGMRQMHSMLDHKLPADRIDLVGGGTIRLRNLWATYTAPGATAPTWTADIRLITEPDGTVRFGAADVALRLDDMQRRNGGRMSARQATVCGQILMRQKFVNTSDLPDLDSSFQYAPTITVTPPYRETTDHILENGAVLPKGSEQSYDLTTGLPLPPAPVSLAGPPVGRAVVTAVVIEPILHGLIALWIGGIGVALLIDPARWVRAHVVYAVAKLFLTLYSVLVVAFLLGSAEEGFSAARNLGYANVPSSALTPEMLIGMLFGFAGQVAYPVVLLSVLQATRVQNFAASRGRVGWPIMLQDLSERLVSWATSSRGAGALRTAAIVGGALVLTNVVGAIMGWTFAPARNPTHMAGLLFTVLALAAAAVVAWFGSGRSRRRSREDESRRMNVLPMMLLFSLTLPVLAPSALRAADDVGDIQAADVEVQELLERAKTGDSTACRKAVEQLIRLGSGRSGDALLELMRDGPVVAQNCVGELIPFRWFMDKSNELASPEFLERARVVAATVVRRLADPQTRPSTYNGCFKFIQKVRIDPQEAELLLQIFQEPRQQGDSILRDAAGQAISGVLGTDEEVLPFLRRLVDPEMTDESTDSNVYQAALYRIRHLKPELSRPFLLESARLRYADRVRALSLGLLFLQFDPQGWYWPGNTGNPQVPPPADPMPADLERLVLWNARGGTSEVQRTAFAILVRFRAKYIEVLVEQLHNPDSEVRSRARACIEEPATGKSDGREYVHALMAHPNPVIRLAGIEVADRALREKLLRWSELIPMLDDPAPEVQRAAAAFLAETGTSQGESPGFAMSRRLYSKFGSEHHSFRHLLPPSSDDSAPVRWPDPTGSRAPTSPSSGAAAHFARGLLSVTTSVATAAALVFVLLWIVANVGPKSAWR